ncbi:MAG: Holliday junction resolvase RuvX [Anaerolineaceae bacterium]|nr:Holliday junction resolvase RuvX [Anaerolineaceae bacterium]
MRVLAIDPGAVRIGIAVSDQTGFLARPLLIFSHESRSKDAERIVKIAHENDCSFILVGQALDPDGRPGMKARSSQRLATEISNQTEKKVMLWDESYTSKSVYANNILMGKSKKSRSKPLDDQAAAILLDDFLQSDIFSTLKAEI